MKVSKPPLSEVALTNMTVIANIKEAIIIRNEDVVRVTAISIWMTFLNYEKIRKYVNPQKKTIIRVKT